MTRPCGELSPWRTRRRRRHGWLWTRCWRRRAALEVSAETLLAGGYRIDTTADPPCSPSGRTVHPGRFPEQPPTAPRTIPRGLRGYGHRRVRACGRREYTTRRELNRATQLRRQRAPPEPLRLRPGHRIRPDGPAQRHPDEPTSFGSYSPATPATPTTATHRPHGAEE